MKQSLKRILWGIVLVAVGVIWGLNMLEITDIDIFFDGWWTLFIIVPSFIGLFDRTDTSRTGNLIAIFIGVMLLLAAQGYISIDITLKLLLPFIVVVIGLSLIFSNSIKTKVNEKVKGIDSNELESVVATFGEQIVNKNNEEVKDANLDCVFGGIIYDLTGSKLKDETVIKASAIFGGVKITVPKDVEVKVKSTPIFGGVSNHVRAKDAKKVIYVDAFCLFGGIEIK